MLLNKDTISESSELLCKLPVEEQTKVAHYVRGLAMFVNNPDSEIEDFKVNEVKATV